MIYNLEEEIERQKFESRNKWLLEKRKKVDQKVINKLRSLPQNAYLHLLLSFFALEYGETESYVKKKMFKRDVNSDIFKTTYVNSKTGEIRVDWKSSAIISTKEMTTAIDRFKDWSAKECGIRLPDANEQNFLDHIKNEIDRNKQWL